MRPRYEQYREEQWECCKLLIECHRWSYLQKRYPSPSDIVSIPSDPLFGKQISLWTAISICFPRIINFSLLSFSPPSIIRSLDFDHETSPLDSGRKIRRHELFLIIQSRKQHNKITILSNFLLETIPSRAENPYLVSPSSKARTTHFPLNLTTYSRGCNRRIDDESPSSSLLSTGCLWPFTTPLSTSFVPFKISEASNVFLRHSCNLWMNIYDIGGGWIRRFELVIRR